MQQASQKTKDNYIYLESTWRFLPEKMVGTILLCDVIDHVIYTHF